MEVLGIVTGLLTALCTAGGVIYLCVQKWFDKDKDKEEVKHQQGENIKEAVEYGVPMITIYNEIDKIVESKTRPIQEKLDAALTRIDILEDNYCCYRTECERRVRKAESCILTDKK